MKKLIVVLLLTTSTLSAQPTSYSLSVEKKCPDCGEGYFFGGKALLEKYLYYSLCASINSGEFPSDTASLIVKIDSLGVNIGVHFLSKLNSCQKCNDLLLKTMESIDRWEPDCYCSLIKKKIICTGKELRINICVRNKNIFVIDWLPPEKN